MPSQTQDLALETAPETLAALSAGNTRTLTPPYPAVYEAVWAPGSNNQLFGWTLVKKPRIGEAVIQLGTRVPNPLWARARGGFKHVYLARANGLHDITIEVAPGPITRRNGAQVAAVAWVQGIGGTFRSVPVFSWRRTTITIPNVPMYFRQPYVIVVAGDVFLPAPNSGGDYGEFIGTFPSIKIEAPYAGLIAEEQEAHARFEQAIADFDSVEEMCSALAKDDDVVLADTLEVSEEELAARGNGELVTSNQDDA